MTLAEKLQVMETLWEDLSRDPETLPSPVWHREVLSERQRRLDAGEVRYVAWDEAKADIQKRLGT